MAKRGGALHVATTRREYKGKVYETHLLRRSFREGKKVKHETLGNLSHLPAELIEIIRRSLAGKKFVSAEDSFQIERSLPYGHVRAVLGTMRKLGLEDLVASKRSRERDIVLALVAERILHPASKLGTVRLWGESVLGEELGVGKVHVNEVYGALDWLLQRQRAIEKKLARRHLSEGALALYDVSSSYYEGSTCPLARFGHCRDGRGDLPIIVYGVLADGDGRPVAMEVYPGDTGDPTTVPDQVSKLRGGFGLGRVVLVGDRGMLTHAKIEALKEHPGLGWISALRSADIRKLREDGRLPATLFDETGLAEVVSPDFPGERLVACFNPALCEERGRKREALLEATERALEKVAAQAAKRTRKPLSDEQIGFKVGKALGRYKMGKHIRWEAKGGRLIWRRDEESVRREKDLDGIYIVRTSEPAEHLSASDTVRAYKGLSSVERAFRCMKGIDLKVRPIFLSTSPHVRAHFFLCMLAYYVEWHMRRDLAPLLFEDEDLPSSRLSRDPVAPARSSESAKAKKATRRTQDGLEVHSFETLLAALATQCRNTCRMNVEGSPAFYRITDATPLQLRAYQLLGL
jgi:hypothetical protein